MFESVLDRSGSGGRSAPAEAAPDATVAAVWPDGGPVDPDPDAAIESLRSWLASPPDRSWLARLADEALVDRLSPFGDVGDDPLSVAVGADPLAAALGGADGAAAAGGPAGAGLVAAVAAADPSLPALATVDVVVVTAAAQRLMNWAMGVQLEAITHLEQRYRRPDVTARPGEDPAELERRLVSAAR